MAEPANNKGGNQGQNQQIQVKVPADKEVGSYSNGTSIHINQNEVVIDFGYIMPKSNPPIFNIVSRVNMSHKSAEALLNILSNAMLDWRNKVSEQGGDKPAEEKKES